MKTRNAVLTLAAMIVTSVLALAANPTPKMAVIKPVYTQVYKVIYEGTGTSEVTLQVSDNKGRVLLSQVIKGYEKFVRPLNFADLEPGVYTISLKDENGTQSQQINYGVDSNSKKEFATSVYVNELKEAGKYLVAVSAKTPEKVQVLIFDGNNNLIHTETRLVNGSNAWVYNLKEVDGTPSFRIIDANGDVKEVR
jgi:hypothetical protein